MVVSAYPADYPKLGLFSQRSAAARSSATMRKVWVRFQGDIPCAADALERQNSP